MDTIGNVLSLAVIGVGFLALWAWADGAFGKRSRGTSQGDSAPQFGVGLTREGHVAPVVLLGSTRGQPGIGLTPDGRLALAFPFGEPDDHQEGEDEDIDDGLDDEDEDENGDSSRDDEDTDDRQDHEDGDSYGYR